MTRADSFSVEDAEDQGGEDIQQLNRLPDKRMVNTKKKVRKVMSWNA